MRNLKNILSLTLVLVMMLSMFVIPTSALEEDKNFGVVVKADKTAAEIVPGVVVTVTIHFEKADWDQLMSDMRLCLVYDKSVYTPDVSTRTFLGDLADYAKDATVARDNDTFGQTCLTAAGATDDEKALYDGGVMIQVGADTTLGASAKKGWLATEEADGISVAEISMKFTVTGDATAIEAGTIDIKSPATVDSGNQYIKYTDGSSTPKQYATANADFAKANILANMPEKDPCEDGHTPADAVKENEVAASCSVAGSYESVVYCSVCKAELSRTTVEVVATGEHVYATETDRKEATCTEDGYVVKACGCGATETTPISATGHTEEEIPAVDATCTTDGATAGVKCSVCDEVITAPTTVPSAGHTAAEAVKENEVAATCTTDGSYESVVYCSVCDAEVSRETVTVSATGHSYGEGKQVKSPTCTTAGETRYTCETCGYVDKRAEPAALGHVEEVIPGKAPTCVDPGYKDAIKCSVCNSYVVAPEKVDALGHTKNEGVVTAPTYSSKGYTTYVCTVCGVEYKDDFVDMLPINFAVAIQEPSITEIRCKDTIVLHAVTTTGEELPDDVTVVWTADNENFKTNEIDDGRALEITSKNKGNTVFTVTVYDVNGTELSSDTVEMYSNAGFFAKIGGFFRTIFGLTKYYEA